MGKDALGQVVARLACRKDGDGRPEAYALAEVEHPELSVTQRKVLAGYDPHTSTKSIQRGRRYRRAVETIQQQRERLQAQRGFRLVDSARFYRDLSENREYRKLRSELEAAEDALFEARVAVETRKREVGADKGDAELGRLMAVLFEKQREHEKLMRRAKDEFVPVESRRRARNNMDQELGYESPKEVHVDQRGLMLEFKDLSGSHLNALREVLAG